MDVIGRENIPDHPCVILAKHQSAWETIAFQAIFPPQIWVLKRSLLLLPFFGWALWAPTLAGAVGVLRMRSLGQDDPLAWLLIPMLGLTLSWGALTAIVHALTPDEKWDARRNPGQDGVATGWGAVLAAIAALFLGGIVLMGTITFGIQKFFEWQLAPPPAAVRTTGG